MDDATRFVRANSYLLKVAPLQLYSSALLFAPHQSIVRKTFEELHVEKLSTWIKRIPTVKEQWDELVQSIESEQSFIRHLAISPNSSFLATSGFESNKIWESDSGRCLKTLEHIGLVAFSDDAMLLAVASIDGIFVWNTTSLELEISYPSSGEEIHSLRFKRNSHILVSASFACTTAWDTHAATLQPIQYLKHKYAVIRVELSNDLTCVARQLAYRYIQPQFKSKCSTLLHR